MTEPISIPEETSTEGFSEAVALMLAKMVPASVDEVAKQEWADFILPRLVASGIDKRYHYRLAKWNCPEQEKTFRACRRALTGEGSIVALVGRRGTGKTVIAAQLIIARAIEDIAKLREPGFSFRWTPYRKMMDVIARFKPLYADFGSVDTDRLMEARAALCRSSLLILDEIHDADDMKMRDRALTDLMDRQYSRLNDVLLISNQTPEEFHKTTNSSTLSRISEHGRIIACTWESWREGERKKLAKHG